MRITSCHHAILMGFFMLAGAAVMAQPAVVINEILADNSSGLADESGQFEDWVEFYNPTAAAIDLKNYYVSDDRLQRNKWRLPADNSAVTTIPAKGYLILWCDSQPLDGPLHAAFGLSRNGEWLGLTAPDGVTVIDSLTFGPQTADISYARTPDGGGRFIFSNIPTPGAANPRDVLGVAQAPQIAPAGGVFNSAVTVSLTSPYPGAVIVYSLDGSVPDVSRLGSTSFEYTAPIRLTESLPVRARVYVQDYLASEPASAMFFIDPPHELPILSFITDPANLFDENIGIYTNWDESGRAWEREVFVSYFEQNQLGFAQPAGLRIQGNSSRNRAKKSFRLYFRNDYGPPELNYPLFDRNAVDKFENLVSRAGYDDDLVATTGTLLRDPLGSELYRRLGFPISHSKFGLLYLNNEFWGIYDFRESVNDRFVRDYYGIANFDVIRLRFGSWELDYGDAVEWNNFLDFVRNNSFESEEMYNQLAGRLDIENFTTVLVHAQATQYRSWTYGAFLIREKQPNARWQITVWDMDRAFTDLSWNGFNYYDNNVNEYWINVIAKRLLENAGYRRYFVNRLCDLFNTTFLPENVVPIIDSLAAHIEYDIPYEVAKWEADEQGWLDNVERLRQFVTDRPQVVKNQLQDYFSFGEPVTIHLNGDGKTGGIRLNTVLIDKFPFTGFYYGENKIAATAVPQPGYRFTGWANKSLPQTPTLELFPTEGLTLQAEFAPVEEQLVINEIMYAHATTWECGDWVEIYNPGDKTVDLSGWSLSDDDDSHVYTFAAGVLIAPGEYFVVSENQAIFLSFYPTVNHVSGNTVFGWDDQDQIRLFDGQHELVDRVIYSSRPPWDAAPANGLGSLALVNPRYDNADPANWQAEDNYGSPGRINFNGTVVEEQAKNGVPATFLLEQNYPNPFSSRTQFNFAIPAPQQVTLKIYDLRGRLVTTLVNARLAAGRHSVIWETGNLSSGFYFYQLVAGPFRQTKRFVLQK